MHQPALLFILFSLTSCDTNNYGIANNQDSAGIPGINAKSINEIGVPVQSRRLEMPVSSFGEWLGAIRLKPDNHVYLYSGKMKENQLLHFAVLDIPVGEKDLQQCADAIMRLRAEYLFEQKRFDEIAFKDNTGRVHAWTGKENESGFEAYLETVFSYCNTASLQRQLKSVADWQEMQPGDVFIKGGFPGHAMIVADVAINEKGRRTFLLAQSYMPAQSIHIVKNPMNENLSPWYEVDDGGKIVTPGWTFYKNQLYRF
jgi:hypothetical protein